MKYIAITDTGYTPCGKWRVVPTEATDEMALNSVDGGFGYSLCVKAAPLPPAEMLLSGEPVAWCDPVEYKDDPWSFTGFKCRTNGYPTMPLYLHPLPAPDDSFSAGVCVALAILRIHGQDSTIREVVEHAGKKKVILFAKEQDTLDWTGIRRAFQNDPEYLDIVGEASPETDT